MALQKTFSFLHTYEASGRYWQGIIKAGLVRPHTGVRLVNPPWGDDTARFNHVARIGGELHAIITRDHRPFIVDRVCGGSPYLDYVFDKELIGEYATVLGNKFLGLQMHETVCNVLNDWGRLSAKGTRFLHEPVDPEQLRPFFDRSCSARWLEYGTLDDYTGKRFPDSYEAAWSEIIAGTKRQIARSGGWFSYCEAEGHGGLAFSRFYALGARSGLAEMYGSQFGIAALRGAAKAAQKPWGVSFAPWGNGVTCFVKPELISWKCPLEALNSSSWPMGPDKGPSAALQRRTFFHTYLSGAHTLHEEWGAEDNLLDWDTGALSSYGRVTREFLDFQDAVPDVGVPFTPVALVLDTTVPPPISFMQAAFGGKVARWFPPRPIDIAWSQIKLGLYGMPMKPPNDSFLWAGMNETHHYPPCFFPELFDIIPSDAPDDAWNRYRRIISIGEGIARPGAETPPMPEQFRALTSALWEMSPFLRVTDMVMQINFREADKTWIIGLYNPRGARRGDVDNTGSELNEAFDVTEILHPKFPFRSVRLLHGWPAATALEVRKDTLHVRVGAGGLAILEIAT